MISFTPTIKSWRLLKLSKWLRSYHHYHVKKQSCGNIVLFSYLHLGVLLAAKENIGWGREHGGGGEGQPVTVGSHSMSLVCCTSRMVKERSMKAFAPSGKWRAGSCCQKRRLNFVWISMLMCNKRHERMCRCRDGKQSTSGEDVGLRRSMHQGGASI